MKKRSFVILLCLVLVAVLTLTLVACDNDNKNVNTYTVTFEGEGIEAFTQTVKEGDKAQKPAADPTLTGYTFDNWYNIGGGVFDFDSPISEDTKITAKWTANTYTVTLDVNGGEALANTTKSVTFGQAFELGVASKDLFSFDGWTLEDGTVLTNEAGVSTDVWNIAGDTTLKAKWSSTDKFTKNGLQYTLLEDGTLSVVATVGADYGSKVEIPAQVGGKAVTVVGSMQYVDAPEVVVPASVKEISASAFANNQFVEVVDLSAFGGTIGNRAFANSKIKIIDLGGTTEIGSSAFENSQLSIVVIPASVKSLGDNALKSNSIIEIAFAGNFPTLGNKVFGDGAREEDNELNIAASNGAWEKLIENTQAWQNDEDYVGAVAEATGLLRNVTVYLYQYTEEEMEYKLNKYGTFKNADGSILLYKGIIDNVAFYFPATNSVERVQLYADTHAYRYLETGTETYLLNYENKTILLLEENEKGETIHNGVLYDYIGEELSYIVPSDITEIAAGAAMFNYSTRFLVIGDNVTKVGDFAFANGRLFGVRFGKNVESIGAYAFFGQDYLIELTFEGENPPTIGEAAFCYIVGGGYAPSIVVNEMTKNLGVKPYIFTPYSSWDDKLNEYVDAFAKSLENISDLLVKVGNVGDAEEDFETIAYSKSSDFKQLSTSSGSSAGTQNKTPYGTIIMSGTEQGGAGYTVIEFDDESGYSGVGYAYYSTVNGYATYNFYNTPKKIQIFYGVDEQTGYIQSFVIYGIFTDSDNFSLRGAEAGAFGEQNGGIFSFDGYGNYSYYDENGATATGTYSVNGATITLAGGMSGNITFDKDAKTITFNDKVLTSLGEEAGVYYDLGMGAKIELDGKAYEDEESGVYYSGKLKLEYNGKTVETGYVLDGTNLKFMLNDEEKSFTYSKTSESIISGYYGYYTESLNFKFVDAGLNGTFENGDISITIDGYYTLTLVDGGDVQNGRYMHFADTNNILFFVDDEYAIVYLDVENNTFELATAAEAGKWYTSSGATYALYLDGQGHSIYDNGGFDYGTYTYDANTNAFNINLKGMATDKDGSLDIEKGYGTMVFDYYGANYVALSREPFKKFGSSYTLSGFNYLYYIEDGEVKYNPISYSVYVIDGAVVFSKYGEMPEFVSYEGEFRDGLTFTKTLQVKGNSGDYVDVDFIIVQDDTTTRIDVNVKSFYAEVLKFNKEGDSNSPYTLYWLDEDKNYVGITYISYGSISDFVNGEVTWNAEHTAFTITIVKEWSSTIDTHVYTVEFNADGSVKNITHDVTEVPKE